MNGQTCTNNILGNRLTKGSNTYGWDALNRMTSYNANTYQYRADGMRTKKTSSSASTTYRYDGQMAVQDVEVEGGVTTTNTYALGARGVDMVTKTSGSTTTVGYPIYDGHGNRVATLTKSGLSFSLTDLRSYGAWGNVLTGDPAGRPRARYVASIGHVQDDESGLIYMRARYYEPGSGRFVCEDPARDGGNWFSYCAGDPINSLDQTGRETVSQAFNLGLISSFFKQIADLIVSSALGKSFSAGDLMNMALKWLIEGGALSGIIKGFESSHKAIGMEALMRKLKFGAAGGLICGGAVGAIMGLKLGEHCGHILAELWEMQMESCEPGGGNFFCGY